MEGTCVQMLLALISLLCCTTNGAITQVEVKCVRASVADEGEEPFKESLSLSLLQFDRKMKMFVVLLILLHVSQHALPGVVEVNEGAESVLLPCRYSGFIEDNPTVMWTRSDLSPTSVHLQGEKGALKEQNQRYRGRTSVMTDAFDTSDFSLTLRKPELSDSGDYTCSFRDDLGKPKVADVQLVVKDHQEEVKVTEGAESVILPCRTTPDLPKDVTVEWTRSDPDFMMVYVYPNTSKEFMKQDNPYCGRTKMYEDLLSSGDVSLTLKYPTDRDTGSYICTVYRNKDILRQKVVLIHVKEPFPSWATAVLILFVLSIIVSAGVLYYFRHYLMSVYQVEVEEGMESVLLPCRTTVHLPADAKIEWRDLENDLVHVHLNSSDQPEEQHQFYRNRTVMEGNLKVGDLSLTLKQLTDGDRNTYTCSVYSRDEKILVKKQVKLTIKIEQVVVDSGEDFVLLPWKITGHLSADAKVEWRDSYRIVHVYQKGSDQPEKQYQQYSNRTKMNEDLLETRDLSLTLKHPTDKDSNTYTCRVYSVEGNTLKKKQVELTVRVCQMEVKEGAESVLLPFRTTPDLHEHATVVWKRLEPKPEIKVHVCENGSDQPGEQDQVYSERTKMNEDYQTTGDLSLTLTCPTHQDSGRYQCKVDSMEGNTRKLKTVLLKVKAGTVQVWDQTEDIKNGSRSIDPAPLMMNQSDHG
ncbi:uncharacterized protein LOC121640433 isoform X1 [Melanotaenia boesemani]|uniref:uncharacterized protein LOC121640433 isoform X1 n=1 Tax=Melanotaenia boesemani TaxID=1250792 RepID=UPI001C047E75|nr:uncharacterized protein LOC121640433 isoform X1 [Melanotaenia boesemani]